MSERNIPDRRMRQPDGTLQVIEVNHCTVYIDRHGEEEYDNHGSIIAYNWAAARRDAREFFGPGTLHVLGAEEGPVSAYCSDAYEDFEDIEDDPRITFWMCHWTQGKPIREED